MNPTWPVLMSINDWRAAALLVLLAVMAPHSVRAQASDDPDHMNSVPSAEAVRLDGAIAIDGHLDEDAWSAAIPATGLRQSQPNEGEAATYPLELRILYDDQALYIGALLTQPGGTVAPLARRDQLLDADGNNGSFNSLTTDKLIIRLDPYHNHLDNAWFEVNPAGVKGDQFNGDPSWDPIWEAATQLGPEGWTAEMRIPFSQLRFSTDREQTWGLQVLRYLDERNEQDMWSFRLRSEAGGPAYFGHLTGLEIARQPRQLEILPYAVTGSRFEKAAAGDPYHDGREARFSAGADVKYLLTSNLTLDATLNPDFGQVEVDPSVLNLSAFETFYEEKRPFFIAGASAFRFGGMRCMFCSNSSGMSAFYSRRIGRPPQLRRYVDDISDFADVPDNTSILGAAKITGRTQSGYTVGVLNAVTGKETAHFTAGTDQPEGTQVVEPLTNYFVGRLRKEFRGGATTFGGILTSTARRLEEGPVKDRLRSHAEAVGLDWRHTWRDREYSWMGSALVSNVAGSPEAMARTQESSAHYFQRPDRSVDGDGFFDTKYDPTATSLRGYGLFSRVGKDSGTLLWEAMTNIRSPGYEVNDLAFLDRSDFAWFNGNIGGSWTVPTNWYRNIFTTIGGATEYNFDGDRTRAALQAFFQIEFLNFWRIRLFGIHNEVALDDRLTRGGPVVKRTGSDYGSFQVSTDARRKAVFDVVFESAWGVGDDTRLFTFRPGLALKPASNVFIQLSPAYTRDRRSEQYVTSVADPTATAFYGNRYVFGYIESTTVSLTTRINWTFSPNLTLQLFAQPFIASGDYSSFREFAAPRTLKKRVYGQDMGTIAYDEETLLYTVDPDGNGSAESFTFRNPDFTTSALRGTAVLRWEYRPGSTLFFVWTQERSGFDPDGDFDFSRARRAIFDQRPMNVFQIKATYWIGR
ncbi:MAG: carbohydrate binding family 9 domain-containing protein [Gemmatimonadetes bacterium]|nr:carbohydrate binding family 9 domain-containing protein [Gemmatimonadota bacterium]